MGHPPGHHLHLVDDYITTSTVLYSSGHWPVMGQKDFTVHQSQNKIVSFLTATFLTQNKQP